MTSMKTRLLVASPNAQFLQTILGGAEDKWEIQRASTEQMVLFLNSQWEPQICLIDGDSELFNACHRLRADRSYQNLGIIVFFNTASNGAEERAFRAGCDQVVS